MKRCGSRKSLLFSICLVLSVPSQVLAFDSVTFKPAADQGFYLVTEQAETLGRKNHVLGLSLEFSKNSVISQVGGVTVANVISDQLSMVLGGSVGILNWLDAGLSMNFIPLQEFTDPAGVLSGTGARLGDVKLNAKIRPFEPGRLPFGMAIVPFFTLPTGDANRFVGNNQVTGGALVALESPRLWEKLRVGANVGVQVREAEALSANTAINEQILFSSAANYSFTDRWQGVVELSGWTDTANAFQSDFTNLEVSGAAKYFPTQDWTVTGGAGAGIINAIGAPDFRVFTSVAYRGALKKWVKREVIRTNKIHFEFNKARILAASYPVLDDMVALIKKRKDVKHVTIEGHTDGEGGDAYNQRLSEQRAASVKEYLVSHGILRSKLSVNGKGEGEPLASNETEKGRALNRRVEFHLELSGDGKKPKVVEASSAPIFQE